MQTVQLFDSWGGDLSDDLFARFCEPGLRRMTQTLQKRVPVIYFGRGPLRDVGQTCSGVDWTNDLVAARARGPVQGNLDPALLFAPPDVVSEAVRRMVSPVKGTGYIVNLGHGILPKTPVESAQAFIEAAQTA